jgi:fructose-bisphosphate aldolase class II
MKDMLQHAHGHGYAVGAFELISVDFIEAIMAAAERCRAPLIVSVAEPHFDFFDVDLLMPALETAARRANVPVAIHFDHGRGLQSAVQGINQGCNGVMVDCSAELFTDNVRITREVVDMAHACGVLVEGELGNVPGVEGDDVELHPGELAFTTVAEARAYVDKTRVDSLAISIGTVHGHMKGKPKLDWNRLKQINESLGIPLVIHGGSGLADDQYRRLAANGVAKINFYTSVADVASACMHRFAGDNKAHYTQVMREMKSAVSDEAERCMRLSGAAGRAAEVLTQCTAWLPVEQVIKYNVDSVDEETVEAIMAEGRRILSTIPGVREVIAAKAMKTDAKYRYRWLVRFCHASVIDNYRKHPAHVAFANRLLRPLAGERLSIDYATLPSSAAPAVDTRARMTGLPIVGQAYKV